MVNLIRRKFLGLTRVLLVASTLGVQADPTSAQSVAVERSTAQAGADVQADVSGASQRINSRDYPSVFQAWNPIDMQSFPIDTLDARLRVAAKHDVLWEEPVSQLGYGVDLVLGAVWDHQHGGLATDFTSESKAAALANRKRMLELNPNMVFLLEVRWRDAPGSFLPEDSPYWKRNEDGTPKVGWENGPEPYLLLEPDNQALAENIARQCKIAIESGIYDGLMFDWDGYLPIVRKVRKEVGDDALIIVNIHDRIDEGQEYGNLINGAFMELAPAGPGYTDRSLGTWESSRKRTRVGQDAAPLVTMAMS